MRHTKASLILLSFLFLSHETNGVPTIIDGVSVLPLEDFSPFLMHNLSNDDPVSLQARWQQEADNAGTFKPLVKQSVGVLSTINSSGSPHSRSVGVVSDPSRGVFLINTNPDSKKVHQIRNSSNKAGLYFSWHTKDYSRQISLAGYMLEDKDHLPIDIPFNGRASYKSKWKGYVFSPTTAEVSELRNYHTPDGQIYCIVERAAFTKTHDGKWSKKEEKTYVARNLRHTNDDGLSKK